MCLDCHCSSHGLKRVSPLGRDEGCESLSLLDILAIRAPLSSASTGSSFFPHHQLQHSLLPLLQASLRKHTRSLTTYSAPTLQDQPLNNLQHDLQACPPRSSAGQLRCPNRQAHRRRHHLLPPRPRRLWQGQRRQQHGCRHPSCALRL